MSNERHLILQTVVIRPSGEWTPPALGWAMVRVVEGIGYWLQGGSAKELQPGDGFVATEAARLVLRASQLGLLKLEFFCVQPQFLNGLLTVAEGHQLQLAEKTPAAHVIAFTAGDRIGQKFSHLVTQSQPESLAMRSALLQLWSQAVSGMLHLPLTSDNNLKLRERFRQLVAKMPDAELATRSLAEMAEQLHCSERHFSRLFRDEFGIPLRSRQTELRLMRAQQLLADGRAKIISVAYESGYRHLGLFNSMFKKRFGMTPSQWRKQKLSIQPRSHLKRAGKMAFVLFLLQFFISHLGFAQTTNAGPHFKVDKYLIQGNSILPPAALGQVLSNVPSAFGTNVTFTEIRKALGELQMAYRERGFVTVSVGLPPQKLTNATVKVKITEGRLANLTVKGNNFYSTENVLRSLPSLHTNMLLNSHVFQRELDLANANRDRQIYPIIGPGPEPGTSELTLKVKDRFPLHGRVEINNQATPGTPDSRVAFSAQYAPDWNREHQIGVQYTFTPLNYKNAETYNWSDMDDPLVANYSAYYRLPLGRTQSLQEQIDESHGKFGYNEVTHQFQTPPPSGRPDLTVYASRSTSDTDLILDPKQLVYATNGTTLGLQKGSESLTLNQGAGLKFSMPLPQIQNISSTFTMGADYKHYEMAAANANIFYQVTTTTNGGSTITYGNVLATVKLPAKNSFVEYFPLNMGISASKPDAWGSTTFNLQANLNVATIGSLPQLAYSASTFVVSTNAHTHIVTTNAQNNAKDNYLTVQCSASREQRLYKDWTMLLRADGQWADTPLFSNEQYGMGGVSGVRGYTDGQTYGDTGWRVSIEPRTPLVNIGMVDGDVPFWVRASVFMDYGETYLLEKISAASQDTSQFWGFGTSLTANIGSHLDGRLTVAVPLIASAITPAWDVHFYFGVGAQF
jgi:hemolysin activation/secretion protein/AraC-like DNA-binding protein